MPRPVRGLHRLSARTVATVTKPGRHSDGGNTYLNVAKGGSKSWVFLYNWHGKPREDGLGSYPTVSLARVRVLAAERRQMLGADIDPRQAGRAADASFAAVAERVIAAKQPEWRGEGTAREWRRQMFVDAKALADIPVDKITTQHVLAAVKPHWQAKPEAARRTLARIKYVLDAATAEGLRSDELANPARWEGHLDKLLPRRPRLAVRRHPAMPYDDVPAFMARLSERPGASYAAVAFTILTGVRSGEAVGARWSEIEHEITPTRWVDSDGIRAVWTIPVTRMKAGREHRVPLSPQAMAIIDAMREVRDGDFVFPGRRRGKSLSNKAMRQQLVRMNVAGAATMHGFRSAFRDWAYEVGNFPNEICEAALAHAIPNQAEAAYRRGDALEKRRALMDAWGAYCTQAERTDVVVPFRA